MKDKNAEFKERINSFDAVVRGNSLRELLDACTVDFQPETTNINMHFHSFFSYNPENWSPTRIAWESKTRGLRAAGLCDFDVLDGLEEFLDAAKLLELRATVNLETRAYLAEFADKEINSPGEPGVTYIMGAGFTSVPTDGEQTAKLAELRQGAADRNRALIDRVNEKLADIAIDYDSDVLPLTPSSAATERHIISAYIAKAAEKFPNPAKLTHFWSEVFGLGVDETVGIIDDKLKLEDIVRAKLAKRGGIGYSAPSPDSFPPADTFLSWVASCSAVPMIAWLDGTSDGESDPAAMLECLISKGAAAINIIPDRNWNYSDPETKALKSAKLAEMVAAADSMNLPINIGTEMNKAGQPFVDDLDGEVLSAHKATFINGADIMVGHSLLARFADYPYAGEKASAEFADRKNMNDFFAAVGAAPPLSAKLANELRHMGAGKAFVRLRENANQKKSQE